MAAPPAGASAIRHPLLDPDAWNLSAPAFWCYMVLVAATATSIYITAAKPFSHRVHVVGKDGAARLAIVSATLYEAGSSWVLSPRTLFVGRTIVALYIYALGVRQVVQLGTYHFKFYTIWNWWLLGIYFTLSAAASWRCWKAQTAQGPGRTSGGAERRSAPAGAEDDEGVAAANGSTAPQEAAPAASSLGRTARPTVLSWWCGALFNINAATVVIVDLVCWLVLYPMLRNGPQTPEIKAMIKRLLMSFASYNQHGFNAALIYGDLLLNCQALHFHWVGPLGLWSLLYSLWANVWYSWTGRWLYPFLDVHKPYAPVAYFGLYMAHWFAFGFAALLFQVKALLMRRVGVSADALQQPAPAAAAAARKMKAQ